MADPLISPDMAEWLRQKQAALEQAYAQDKSAQADEDRKALLMQFANQFVYQRPMPAQPRKVGDAREQFGAMAGLEGEAMKYGAQRSAKDEERAWREAEAERTRAFQAGEGEKDRASREKAAAISSRQRDRSLDIQEDRAKAAQEAASAKRRMVSDAQVKAIADYDRGIRILEDMIREKPQIDTGPGASARNWLAQKVGVDDPQVTAYKSQVNDFLAQYIRSISGAATTDKERAFLLQNMPKLADQDAVFEAKANKVLRRLRELRALELDLMRRQGKDTSEMEDVPVMQRGEGMEDVGASASPGSSRALSPRDEQAKAWAEANPDDPRAAKILERLKAKGVL